MASHSTHGDHSDFHQCKCGHTFAKDYQRVQKVTANRLIDDIRENEIKTGTEVSCRRLNRLEVT